MSEPQADRREIFLRKLSLLEGVPEDVFREFAGHTMALEAQRGERLFSEGDPAETLYMIGSGWVKILRETAQGKSVLFEILGPGDLVGAVAVLDGKPFPATAIVAGPAEIFTLPGKTFRRIAHNCPQLHSNYAREIGQRMREARDWQTQLVSGIEGRIAQLFLRLAERIGQGEDGSVELPRMLTRQEIADMVGTTVETAIRTLSRWNKDGLVLSEEERFVIKDLKKLSVMASHN